MVVLGLGLYYLDKRTGKRFFGPSSPLTRMVQNTPKWEFLAHFDSGVMSMRPQNALGPSLLGTDDEPVVDLRGPSPRVGQTFREVDRYEMKGAEFTLKADGNVIATGEMDMTIVREELVTVNATDGRLVTKFATRVVKDEGTVTIRAQGRSETKDDLGELAGQLIVSEKGPTGWTHALPEGQPTQLQKEALANRSPWDDEDEIPAGKQRIGVSWELDATRLKKIFGSSCSAASGKVRAVFVGLKRLNDEPCAVIESTGSLKTKMKLGEHEQMATVDLKFTEYRSLKRGITLKEEGEAVLRMSWVEKLDGKDVHATLQGKIKGGTTQEILR
jgi:hypothetical protein